MHELSLQLKTVINSECWTFIRTSIIETLPFGMEWMCNNLAISTKQDGCIIFGVHEKPYTLSHYDELLEINSVNWRNIKNDDIIKYITDSLDNQTYISILSYMPLIYGYESETIEDDDFHDYIVYGYDTDKQYVLMALFDSEAGFLPREIPYDTFRRSYKIMTDYLRAHPDFALLQSRVNAFPITQMKAKPYQYSDGMFLCDSLNTIKEYITPKKYLIEQYDDMQNMADAYSGYSGLGCIIGLINLLEKYFDGHETLKGIRELYLTVKKIHERHALMERMLSLMQKKLNIVSPIYIEMLDKYHNICESASVCFSLVMKFRLTGDEAILHRIREIYAAMYKNEYLLLNDIYSFLCSSVQNII